MNLLKVENLSLSYEEKKILRSIFFEVEEREHLGITGESGAGKSILARLILALLPESPLFNYSGQIIYKGENLPLMDEEVYFPLRLKELAIAFQDPVVHLDPLFPIKSHFREVYYYHRKELLLDKKWIRESQDLLSQLGLANPDVVMEQYPFQLSGGQAQLVLLGLSLSCQPSLFVGDEITSSLDMEQQVKLVEFLISYFKDTQSTMILISHDLRFLSHLVKNVVVLFQGMDVEYGPTEELMKNPLHPYTDSLIGVAGSLSLSTEKISPSEVLEYRVPQFSEGKGCLYYYRCEKRYAQCLINSPPRTQIGLKRWVRCFLYDQ